MISKLIDELASSRLDEAETEFSQAEDVKEAAKKYHDIYNELKKSITDKAALNLLNELDSASTFLTVIEHYHVYKYGLKDGIELITSVNQTGRSDINSKGGALVG